MPSGTFFSGSVGASCRQSTDLLLEVFELITMWTWDIKSRAPTWVCVPLIYLHKKFSSLSVTLQVTLSITNFISRIMTLTLPAIGATSSQWPLEPGTALRRDTPFSRQYCPRQLPGKMLVIMFLYLNLFKTFLIWKFHTCANIYNFNEFCSCLLCCYSIYSHYIMI